MTAPGSTHDHDALVLTFATWRGLEIAFDDAPTADNAAMTEMAFSNMKAAAVPCGMDPAEPSPVRWVRQRILSFGALMNRVAEAEAIVSDDPRSLMAAIESRAA